MPGRRATGSKFAQEKQDDSPEEQSDAGPQLGLPSERKVSYHEGPPTVTEVEAQPIQGDDLADGLEASAEALRESASIGQFEEPLVAEMERHVEQVRAVCSENALLRKALRDLRQRIFTCGGLQGQDAAEAASSNGHEQHKAYHGPPSWQPPEEPHAGDTTPALAITNGELGSVSNGMSRLAHEQPRKPKGDGVLNKQETSDLAVVACGPPLAGSIRTSVDTAWTSFGDPRSSTRRGSAMRHTMETMETIVGGKGEESPLDSVSSLLRPTLKKHGAHDSLTEKTEKARKTQTVSRIHRTRTFALREVWWKVRMQDRETSNYLRSTTQSHWNDDGDEEGMGAGEYRGSCRADCVLNPVSAPKIFLDMLSVFAMLVDAIMIPLLISFDLPPSQTLDIISWVIRIFWTVDIVVNFNTGHYLVNSSKLVTSRIAIAKYYIGGMFIFDAAVVGLDWGLFFAGTDTNASRLTRMSKFVRLLRFLRMLRLFRILRFSNFVEQFTHQVLNDVERSRFLAIKIVCMVLVINHFLACAWFAIGRIDGQGPIDGWVGFEEMDSRPFGHQYLVSLQWALSNFGVGGSLLYARTSFESLFTVFVSVFALIASSTLVSTVTNSFAHLQQSRSEEEYHFGQLRNFLVQNNVPKGLSRRVQTAILHRQESAKQMLQVHDVQLLKLLSVQLRGELQHYIYESYLEAHDFFLELSIWSRNMMSRIANQALASEFLACGDLIFYRGEVAESMIFLPGQSTSKVVEYNVKGEHVDLQDEALCKWLSEPALWTAWVHIGSLRNLRLTCELVYLGAQTFADIVVLHPWVHKQVKYYAKAFVTQMNAEYNVAIGDEEIELAKRYDLCGNRVIADSFMHGRSGTMRVSDKWWFWLKNLL